MYQVESFREDDLDAQIALVRANPLGLIVSQGPQGLMADPIPFLIDSAWLCQLLTQLTAVHEGNRPHLWHLIDAPADYIAANIKGIVGIEIAVIRREGKWKMSQNRSAEDIDGVIDGLRGGDESQQRLADEVERRRG